MVLIRNIQKFGMRTFYCCFKVEIINRLIVYFRFRTKPLHPYFWCPVGKMTYFTSYHRRKELENSILDFDRIQNSNVHEFHAWQLTCKHKTIILQMMANYQIQKNENITIISKFFSLSNDFNSIKLILIYLGIWNKIFSPKNDSYVEFVKFLSLNIFMNTLRLT